MADPFVAEIRIFPFDFPPTGWAWCDGQLLPLSQNTALFSLLGTSYGGNGRTNFALPNLQGRVAIGTGQAPGLSSYDLGDAGGSQTVTLLLSQMPAHNHDLVASVANATTSAPSGNMLAAANAYASLVDAGAVHLWPEALAHTGGTQAHDNMQPYLGLYFCIALKGVFPPRN